jgi:hypothetical protein
MLDLLQFAFIFVLPLFIVAGALVSLFGVAALFDVLDHPDEIRGRIEGLFRRPPREPRSPGGDHYYRPYWLGR